jgi:hypothetical protein
MTANSTVHPFQHPYTLDDPLTSVVRDGVNGSLTVTHFRFDRRLQSDPLICRLLPPGQAVLTGVNPHLFSFALFGRAMIPARRLSFRR